MKYFDLTPNSSVAAPANRIGERNVEGFTCSETDLTLKDCTIETSFATFSDCSAPADMYAGVNCLSSGGLVTLNAYKIMDMISQILIIS